MALTRTYREPASYLSRTVMFAVIAIGVAMAGGIVSARWALDNRVGFGEIQVGPWVSAPQLGLEDADPYTRAQLARGGVLPLGPAEGARFIASLDNRGLPLNAACSYVLSGILPTSRVWTLRAIAPPEDKRTLPFALNSRSVLHDDNGGLTVRIARTAQAGNWLYAGLGGNFQLALTLYDTPVSGTETITDIPLPTILRTVCDDR